MGAPFMPPRRGVRKWVLLAAAALVLLWIAAVATLAARGSLSRLDQPSPEAPSPANVGRPLPAVDAKAQPAGGGAVPAASSSPVRVWFAPAQPNDPDPIDRALIALIDSARESAVCAFYDLELAEAADALIARHAAGVRVGVVSDSDYADRPAARRCAEAGIPVVFDERPAFMHDKFCVVDGRFVWTGSTNITENCMYRNNNNAVLVESAELARNFAAEFGEMFDGRCFGAASPRNTPLPELILADGTRLECYFAPEDDAGAALARFAASARERIDFAAFAFTSKDLAEAVAARIRAGVRVRGVFEKRGANAPASRLAWLAERGAAVRTDTNPANLHHKFLVVDGAAVATGSFNFSRNADERNDENLLILHSPALARRYLEEVDRLMN